MGNLAPLLPELRPTTSEGQTTSDGASILGAIFNVSITMIGAGIMSIPATLKVLGIIPAFVVIVIVAALVEVTVEFLLRYTRSSKSATYGGLMAESFGTVGAVAVQVCVIVTNFGVLIIYLIIVGDVLCGNQSGKTLHLGILQQWFGAHWWNSRAYALLFIVLFVMLPLHLLRRVDSLRYSSAISILLALVFVAISSAMAIIAVCQGKTQKLRLFPDFSSPQVSFLDLFTTVPVFVTGLAFHANVHPIRAELSRPNSDMSFAVRISLVLCVVIYFAIGFFGYLLFGDAVAADVLVNFDQSSDSATGSLVNAIVRLSYALHLMLVFPLMNFTLRANVDELLFPKRSALAADTPRFVCLTCVILGLAYVAAIAIPDIWYYFQLLGSTSLVCLGFVFPGAIVLRDVHGVSTTKDRIVAVLVIILAVGTSLIAISTNIQSPTSKKG